MDNLAAKRRERGEVNETDISDFASFDESELLFFLHLIGSHTMRWGTNRL